MTNITSAASGGTYPVLPLRDIVVFPHMIVPLFVGREKSIRALEEVMGSDKQIMLVTQINASDDDPAPEAIHKVGTVANVLQLLKLASTSAATQTADPARSAPASGAPCRQCAPSVPDHPQSRYEYRQECHRSAPAVHAPHGATPPR